MKDVLVFLRNAFMASMRGEFLQRLNAGKYFIHIAYVFLLFGLVIWGSLMIETTMAKVEEQKAVLRELEIANAQKYYDIARLSGRYAVDKRLESLGSQVREPEKPAYEIDR